MKFSTFTLIAICIWISSCESERIEPNPVGENQIQFIKQSGSDPTDAQNQDRITDNVWITRGNGGGQIFNARVSTEADKQTSPLDTEWALGTLDDLDNLTFDTFRRTITPKQVVGRDLVVHLITDDIYLNIRFTSWSSGREGGFGYVRDRIIQQPQ